MRRAKQVFWIFLVCLSITSCTLHNAGDSEQHKTEFALHKMRTDIEELKQDLNSNQIELNILEGKILQKEKVSSSKDKEIESLQQQLASLCETMETLKQKLQSITKRQEKTSGEIVELTEHANETNAALSQYKSRISEMEGHIAFQNDKIKEATALLKNALAQQVKNQPDTNTYIVQKGDTLKKIAQINQTSAAKIKKINHLNDDMIYAGQEIIIPKNEEKTIQE